MREDKRVAARFGLPLCLLFVSLPAYDAEPYRLELHGEFSTIKSNDSSYGQFSAPGFGFSQSSAGNTSRDRLGFSGEYFFDPVESNSGPLKEAAFLAKTSGLMFSVSGSDAQGEGRTTTTSDIGDAGPNGTYLTDWKARNYNLRYRFVAPQNTWFGVVGGSYLVRESNLSSLDHKRTRYSVGIGRYVGRRTSVVAKYGRSHLDAGVAGLRDETLSVGVRSLIQLGTRHHLATSALLEQTNSVGGESVRTYQVGLAYYPRNDLSIALSTTGNYDYSAPDGDRDGDVHRRGYLLEADWFVTEEIALGIGYETSDDRSNYGDPNAGNFGLAENSADGIRLNVSWRR